MNEESLAAIERLSERLGLATEQLIAAFAQTVPALWWPVVVSLAIFVVAIVAAVGLARTAARIDANADERSPYSLGSFPAWVMAMVCSVVVLFAGFSVTGAAQRLHAAYLSPEAYAVTKIMELVRP